jgi:predicted 3-demethylubiquinone-9 3-methyltransferase (glyoxalase superfamily)
MTVAFQLAGQSFGAERRTAFQKFEAVSFQVYCDSQAEVDHFWSKLSAGARKGLRLAQGQIRPSWQVVPVALLEMLMDPDARKSARVMKAFLKIKKFDIAALKRAYEGEAA